MSQLFCESETNRIVSSLKSRFLDHNIIVTDVNPMIALNTGPGLILITYFSKTD